MLKIYGAPRSRTVRVLWLAGELGIEYEHMSYMPRSPETRTQQYLAINPNARVPSIDDEGFILTESMAINIYLAKKHKSPLWPDDAKQQALILQWSLWETDRLDRQLVNWARHTKDLPEAERKADVANAMWQEIEPAFGVLETALGKSEWLTGSAFTVGDLNVASALFRALSMDLSKWPRAQAWLKRCWDRPAAQRAKAMREA